VRESGGFHQDYDREWRRLPGEPRALVFQARMTWVAARLAARPGGERFREWARHGVEFLRRMRIPGTGGFLWEIGGTGRPRGAFAGQVHAYGLGFAIFALATAADALRSDRALSLARAIFAYLEGHHFDGDHGGYLEVTRTDGRPGPRWRPWQRRDAIGTPYGLKSQNSHLHLLEAFVPLYRLWPDERLRLRVEGLVKLMTEQFWVEPGRCRHYMTTDWKPAGDSWSYGHGLEVAHLLLAAAGVLGRPHDPDLVGKAEAIVETAFVEAWQPEGGFFDRIAQGRSHPEPLKTWWVQMEGLAAFAALLEATGKDRYRHLLERQWEWIVRCQVDREHGGFFESVAPDGTPVGNLAKGHRWKDAYHEVRALLAAIDAIETT
jgi:mannobiose 2-epimerase